MRNSINKILFIVSGIILFSSCEQVIELDLRDSDARIVVEGTITDEPGSCRVKISRVVNYDAANTPNPVSGANVTLIDNGTSYILEEAAPGLYELPLLTGVPGHTYQLSVLANGNIYNATCKMPEKISLDTLYLDEEVFFVDTNLTANFEFQDISGIRNFYRYIYDDNEKNARRNILIDDDTFYDGQLVEQLIVSFNDQIETGDTIRLELWCIDEAVHLYYKTLASIIDGSSGQLAAPANPTSNISGGALGYFSAYTVSQRIVVVQ
jgi:hypothetical protein